MTFLLQPRKKFKTFSLSDLKKSKVGLKTWIAIYKVRVRRRAVNKLKRNCTARTKLFKDDVITRQPLRIGVWDFETSIIPLSMDR